MSTNLRLRRALAAGWLASVAALALAPDAVAQAQPTVTANPNTGAPGSSFTLTLSGFDTLAQCNPSPATATRQTCIFVDFVQGTRTSNIAVASGSNAAAVKVPPACPTPASTGCTEPGAATIKATSPNGQNASTAFTVTPAGATTSSSSTTTRSSTTTSSSTTSSTSSTSTSTTETTVLATTPTTTLKKKKASSHSDLPRYIAVALVVLAAAATAAVDTRLRRVGPA